MRSPPPSLVPSPPTKSAATVTVLFVTGAPSCTIVPVTVRLTWSSATSKILGLPPGTRPVSSMVGSSSNGLTSATTVARTARSGSVTDTA